MSGGRPTGVAVVMICEKTSAWQDEPRASTSSSISHPSFPSVEIHLGSSRVGYSRIDPVPLVLFFPPSPPCPRHESSDPEPRAQTDGLTFIGAFSKLEKGGRGRKREHGRTPSFGASVGARGS